MTQYLQCHEPPDIPCLSDKPPRVPLVEAREDVRVLARLAFPYTVPSESKFASIHSDPPGPVTAYPAVLECVYGKGRGIYSVAPLENEDYVVYQSIVRNFIDR